MLDIFQKSAGVNELLPTVRERNDDIRNDGIKRVKQALIKILARLPYLVYWLVLRNYGARN